MLATICLEKGEIAKTTQGYNSALCKAWLNDSAKLRAVMVSMPKELHQQLKDISETTGIPMSTMMLQATIEKYLGDRTRE